MYQMELRYRKSYDRSRGYHWIIENLGAAAIKKRLLLQSVQKYDHNLAIFTHF